MKNTRYLLMLFIVVFPVKGARYADPVLLVQEGLDDYERKGIKRAMITWGVDSTHAIAEALMKSEKMLGKIKNYDISDRVDVSTKSVIVYSTVNYEYGPLFVEFHLYRSSDTWIVLDITPLSMGDYREKLIVLENSKNLSEMVQLQRGSNSLLNEQCKANKALTDSLLKTVNRLGDNVQALSEKIADSVNAGLKK